MNSKIIFENNFITGIEILETAKTLYSMEDYEECLSFISESLEMLDLTSSCLFSDFLLLTGNVLWKESQKEQAAILWEKALRHNTSNRKARLCLELLAGKKLNDCDDCFETAEYYTNSCGNYPDNVQNTAAHKSECL